MNCTAMGNQGLTDVHGPPGADTHTHWRATRTACRVSGGGFPACTARPGRWEELTRSGLGRFLRPSPLGCLRSRSSGHNDFDPPASRTPKLSLPVDHSGCAGLCRVARQGSPGRSLTGRQVSRLDCAPTEWAWSGAHGPIGSLGALDPVGPSTLSPGRDLGQ